MLKEQIENVSIEKFIKKEWDPLVKFFWKRYNMRYFNPIAYLQKSTNFDIRNNCGFIITTIDCALIETLHQFYCGTDKTKGKNRDPYFEFFKKIPELSSIITNEKDAGLFLGFIRDGLVHQTKTKKASIINRKCSTAIIEWIDKNEKDKGFKINRDKFHEAVYNEFENLIEQLKKDENIELRERFRKKLITIVD